MKITLNQKDFYERLEMVGRVSAKHVTLPVLQCVYLEAKGSDLVMRATNLEIAVEATVVADVTEEGVVAVPASVLLQTVSLNKEKSVTLRAEDGGLVVEASGSETLIKSIPHEEFPSIPKVEGGGQTINNHLFSLGIKSSAFAASVSSIKPELGSVYIFQKKEHSLTFVATDSFRLMEKSVPQKGVIFESSVLLPQKNALEIARVLDSVSSDPVCRFNDNQFSLEFSEGVYITSRLISGSFPDYEQIMPKEFAAKVTLLKEDLVRAFKKTSIFLNKFAQVGLYITKGSLTVSAVGGELGTTTESLKAETEGEELTLNFNQRYLSEVLSHMVDDSVVLQFSGVGRPVVIKGVSDASVRYLVMPMNK
ncbi:DNA polymerase III subunit beta [Candidatus Nomurabacteria bacterium]|nr:DNA polymerase III subunit beta [Candidatus Nomurabacteria bacterium]MCB9819609.1 DNA polymerase III subunit beta [Candidatus Nomurabacteria bacterium]